MKDHTKEKSDERLVEMGEMDLGIQKVVADGPADAISIEGKDKNARAFTLGGRIEGIENLVQEDG